MKVDLFDFDLPETSVALRPARPREAARLLVLPRGGPRADRTIADLPDCLRAGDALVINDTRVIPAQLAGTRLRAGGGAARVDVTLHRRDAPDCWTAFARPAKRLAVGDRVVFGTGSKLPREGEEPPPRPEVPGEAGPRRTHDGNACFDGRLRPAPQHEEGGGSYHEPGSRDEEGGSHGLDPEGSACGPDTLSAEVIARREAEVELRFALSGAALDEAIARHGSVPLPPYIARRRPTDARDAADYQTVYAREPGAVAAPTAGLHLSDAMLARLGERGVSLHRLTLHVGAGTFLPVSAGDTADHVMHAETGRLDAAAAEALNEAKASGRRIVAVGTTSLRLLESAVDAQGRLKAFDGSTSIFITPGYRFRAVDVLLTNFHLPRSTLFMLVSAFAGLDRMQEAYRHAVAAGYRFYSYGDACLLERGG